MSSTTFDAIEAGNKHLDKTLAGVLPEDVRHEGGNSYTRPGGSLINSADEADDHRWKRSNNVQKCTVCMVVLLFAMLAVVIAVCSASYWAIQNLPKPVTAVTTVYTAMGLPQYEQLSWNDVTTQSYGETVNFWIGPAPKVQRWVINWLKPQLYQQYRINLNVTLVSQTYQAVSHVQNQVNKSGVQSKGDIDIIFINNAQSNFNKMKSKGLLYGPFASKIPSASNFDFNAANIAFDFGQPVGGFEMPLNSYQVIFCYNVSALAKSNKPTGQPSTWIPQSMSDLVQWIKLNPGKFTYPNPVTDGPGAGAGFVEMFLYEFGSTPYSPSATVNSYTNYKSLLGSYSSTTYKQQAPNAFDWLQAIQPYLYQLPSAPGVPYYPATSGFATGAAAATAPGLDNLFATGEVYFTIAYDILHASVFPGGKVTPPTVVGYVPSTLGSISNVANMAIPINAAHKLGALTVVNFASSIQAQFSRREPNQPLWIGGMIQAYSTSCPAIVDEGWQVPFDYLHTADFPSTPALTSLRDPYALPTLDPQYNTNLANDWVACVANNAATGPTGLTCSA